MARRVFSLFPSALFVHFYDEKEEEPDQRNGLLADAFRGLNSAKPVNVILVDSVINSGSSIQAAVKSIRRMAGEVNPELVLAIYVLTGVMQHLAAERLPSDPQLLRVRFIALRVSENKYVGKGGTDTGARLFGTTLIDADKK